MKIFIGDGREVFIDFIESSPINFNSNFILKSFIVFTAAVILLVNGSIIRWDFNCEYFEASQLRTNFVFDFFKGKK